MRTSPVNPAVRETYRNERMVVQSGGDFRSVTDFKGSNQQQQSTPKKKKGPAKSAQKRTVTLKKMEGAIIIKGMQLRADTATIHNVLRRRAIHLKNATQVKQRNETYRTSI